MDPATEDTDALEAVEALLTQTREHVKYYHSSQYINDLANGEICVAMGFSGDVFIAADRAAEADNGVNIEYIIPEEGTLIWFDVMAIPADAPNPEAAHTWINYILRPDVMAGITNYVWYANAVPASLEMVDEEVRTDPAIFPSEETQANLFAAAIKGGGGRPGTARRPVPGPGPRPAGRTSTTAGAGLIGFRSAIRPRSSFRRGPLPRPCRRRAFPGMVESPEAPPPGPQAEPHPQPQSDPRRMPRPAFEPWRDPAAQAYVRVEGGHQEVRTTFIAVDDVDLAIYRGEFFSLLGASGCGKTTLLRMLAGFERPSQGRIWIDGVDVTDVPPYERPVNMMFQSYALFPHMTVEANVAFGLKQDRVPKAEIRERVAEALALVQLERFAKRKPHQLSGGQRQRVALARSLIKRAEAAAARRAAGRTRQEAARAHPVRTGQHPGVRRITFVVVTHDQEEAMTMSSRIAVDERRPDRPDGHPGGDLRVSPEPLRLGVHRPDQTYSRVGSPRTRPTMS